MEADENKQKILDEEHLRLLSIFHYITGGLTIAFSLFMFLYLGFFAFVLSNIGELEELEKATGGPDPEQVIGVVVTLFSVLVMLNLVYGILQIFSGVFLKKKKHRMFSFIVALPNILMLPYGTILAIFTLMVLARDSVKALYESATTGERSF